MPTLAALLHEHRDRIPRTPCAGLVGGELVTVRRSWSARASFIRAATAHPAARQLVTLHLVEVADELELVERQVSGTSWQHLEASCRGRALSAQSPRRQRKTA